MQDQPVGGEGKLHGDIGMYFPEGLQENFRATKFIIVLSSKRVPLVGVTPQPTSLDKSRRSSFWKSLGR